MEKGAELVRQKLKYLYDTTKIKFIISGSSSLELTYQTGKYMVGRIFQFLITPFSFREFLEFQDSELSNLLNTKIPQGNIDDFDNQEMFGSEVTRRLSEQLEKFVVFGGYPAVVLAQSEEEKQKIQSSNICVCPSFELAWYGHKAGCIESNKK